MVRFSYVLLALLLSGCAGAYSATILVEAESEAVSPGGTLIQPIGIETLGGAFTPLLQKGCQLPCTITQSFSTAEDDQDQIRIGLFRGSAVLAKDAHSLGTYVISGITPMPRGEPSILVEFTADHAGITLTATDRLHRSRLGLSRVAP